MSTVRKVLMVLVMALLVSTGAACEKVPADQRFDIEITIAKATKDSITMELEGIKVNMANGYAKEFFRKPKKNDSHEALKVHNNYNGLERKYVGETFDVNNVAIPLETLTQGTRVRLVGQIMESWDGFEMDDWAWRAVFTRLRVCPTDTTQLCQV